MQHLATQLEHGQLNLFSDDDQTFARHPPLTLATLTTFLRDCFIAEGYASTSDMSGALVRGQVALQHFFQWWASRNRSVLAVEEGFKLSIGTVAITGRFDRVERLDGCVTVIDFKTTRPRTQQQLDTDLQLSIYALAAAERWRETAVGLSLLFVNDDACIEMRTTRTAAQLNEARSVIAAAALRIDRSDFTAMPSAEKCTRCPYRGCCPSALPRKENW